MKLSLKVLSFSMVVLTVATATLTPSIAAAARRKKVTKPVATEATLPIQQSQLPLDTYLPDMAEEKPVTVELGVSSWAPQHFNRTSRTGDESNFSSGSLPMISINRIGLISSKVPGLYSKFGLSFANLEREISTPVAGNAVTLDEQNLSLFSARLGAEYRTRRFVKDFVQPFASLAALPTWGLASRSAAEGKVNTWGVPFEAAAGVSIALPFLPSEPMGLGETALGLGAHYLFGSVGGSRTEGLGVQGSLRVDL